MALNFTLHGAGRTVTGSTLEFTHGATRLLVDHGMFQGSRSLEELNRASTLDNPGAIAGVILTHAHIDHCGLLPRLVADGYTGPIWCTRETADLIEYMLADSGRIQESEALRQNRRRDRRHKEDVEPLYTEADALAACKQARVVGLHEWFEPAPGFRARLWNAGHILGAASVELECDGVHWICSGDIGPDNKAFEPAPEGPQGFDHVICESTYGNRERTRVTIEERRALLAQIINEALGRGGNLIIPAFALERTQELLLDIATLSREGHIGNAMVFVDSPLANRTTQVFARYQNELEDTGGKDVFHHPSIHYVSEVMESMRLNTVSGAIIMAASGMCEAGRIRHHLFHNLHRRESTVLFVGFQAQGSLGRIILDGAQHVRISGRDVEVRATIRQIDSYSAHADQRELLAWIAARGPIAGSLMLDHGESDAIDTLAGLARDQHLAASVVIPEIGETYELNAGQPVRRIRAADPTLAHRIGRDWQNEYADLASGLKHRLEAIKDAERRKQAIAEMRKVLDSYTAFRDAKKDRSGAS